MIMDTTISNQHLTDHDGINGLFIRETNHPEAGHTFAVLYASDGSYAGDISDGSDCTFSTMAEAEAWMQDSGGE